MGLTVKSERGIALVVILMFMAVLMVFSGAGLLFSGLNLRTTAYFKTGNLAFYAAESGIQHALTQIPVGTTFSYTGLPLLDSVSFGNGYSYTVTAINDADPTRAILTSTAKGPNSSTRTVKAYIARDSWVPPGALYVPGDPLYIETQFNGSAFRINGKDTNPGGSLGPESPVPGIATSAVGTTNEIKAYLLSSPQYPQVTGLGNSPSVATSTAALDVDQLATNLTTVGVEGFDKQTKPGGSYTGGEEWGTSISPKITYITGDAQLSGLLSGYGVLIVDGNLSTRGNFSFSGLIIVRGHVSLHGSAGSDESATVWGAVLVKEGTSPDAGIEMEIGGRGTVNYSSQTIAKVVSRWSLPFSALPSPAKLISWQEVM